MTRPARRCMAAALAPAAVGLAAAPADAQPAPPSLSGTRPNVVFVLMDDVHYNALGATANGSPFVHAPHLRRLADEGRTFGNTYCTTPMCTPGRASFLSGTYAQTHRATGNSPGPGDKHQRDLVTYNLYLQTAGYETAHFGKWHFGGGSKTDDVRPFYDHWVGIDGTKQAQAEPILNINGQIVNDYANSPGKDWVVDVLSDEAAQFIRNPGSSYRNNNQPFVVTIAHQAVHNPQASPDEFKDLYSGPDVDLAPSAKASYSDNGQSYQIHDEKPVFTDPGNHFAETPVTPAPTPGSTGTSTGKIGAMMKMLTHADQAFGRVIDALEDTGQMDNTLIVFSSDNGYFWGEHGLTDKRWAYEEAVRLPLFMYWKDRIQAGTTDAYALNIDFGPTLVDLAGLDKPLTMEGQSLVPILENTATSVRDGFLTEYFLNAQADVPTWRAVREGDLKYIRYFATDDATPGGHVQDYDELYDLSVDPFEMNNLIDEPAYAAQIHQLKQSMQERLAEIARPTESGAGVLAVISDDRDHMVLTSGTTGGGDDVLRVGNDRNAMFAFELPSLEPDQIVAGATVTIDLLGGNGLNPGDHADLWAVEISASNTVNEYLAADDRPTGLKLQDNILGHEALPGAIRSDSLASELLAEMIRQFYEDQPNYNGGQFLFVRLNPDDTFGGFWEVGSADFEQDNGIILDPSTLVLQIVPEPATLALIALAGPALLRRRRH